jgi:hypothetical protein
MAFSSQRGYSIEWDPDRLTASANVPIPVEVGKPMITFCVQRDDVCYNSEEATAIIEDFDETFRAIEQLIESAHSTAARVLGALRDRKVIPAKLSTWHRHHSLACLGQRVEATFYTPMRRVT